MPLPLQIRFTLFYTFLLGLALLFFGQLVYGQAEHTAYQGLDDTLSSRAASVRFGKFLACSDQGQSVQQLPQLLAGVDTAGTGVSVEVLDGDGRLLASTSTYVDTVNTPVYVDQNSISSFSEPMPWDRNAFQQTLQRYRASPAQPTSMFSTILYEGQLIRVYTLVNGNDFCPAGQPHVIQTARSEQEVEQSLDNLRNLLLMGGALVLVCALLGGWLMLQGALGALRRITRTAQRISEGKDFSRRVPLKRSPLGRDEFTTLAETFNSMLANLEEAYRRQQRFIADASHELRAPVTSIRCNLDLLARAPDLPPAEVRDALNDAHAEANRMGRLVNDLLLLARGDEQPRAPESERSDEQNINGYKKSLERQRIDLDSLLLEVYRQYHPASEGAEGAGATTSGPRLVLQHITPAQVYGDADRLKQALVALLDNALKYTPYEGQVALSLATEENRALLRVSDSGIGIAPEDLPHIFERFYRADRARSRDRGSSGLGLAIAQAIAREHNGTIEVESAPGKGSTFTLKLPLAQDT